MDVCSGSLLFSLVLMSTVFSSRLRLLLTYVSPSDNCIEIEAGIARTLQFPVLKDIYVQIIVMGLGIQNFGFFESLLNTCFFFFHYGSSINYVAASSLRIYQSAECPFFG